MNSNLRWLLWLAALILAVMALLIACGVVTATLPWLVPAAVVALSLAVGSGYLAGPGGPVVRR
jgi:hypothetical protein